MGIDVNLYVGNAVSAEEFERGAEEFARRSDQVSGFTLERGWENRVEISTMSRYWGPGYERGDWPTIHTAIRALRAAFPGHPIHYGGDSDFDAPEVTDDMLADYWTHWESPQWDAYHSRHDMAAARPEH